MNIKAISASFIVALTLTACGGEEHEHVKAVDKVEDAQAAALAKKPQAEEIIFDDHGEPTFGNVGGANADNTKPTDDAQSETAETKTEASEQTQATDKQPEAQTTEETPTTEEKPAQEENSESDKTEGDK